LQIGALGADHPWWCARGVGRPIGTGRRRHRDKRGNDKLAPPRPFAMTNVAGRQRRQLSCRAATDGAPGTRRAVFAGLRCPRRLIDNHRAVRRANHHRLGHSGQVDGVDERQSAHQRVRGHREGNHEQQERSQSCAAPSHAPCMVYSGSESYGRNTTVRRISKAKGPLSHGIASNECPGAVALAAAADDTAQRPPLGGGDADVRTVASAVFQAYRRSDVASLRRWQRGRGVRSGRASAGGNGPRTAQWVARWRRTMIRVCCDRDQPSSGRSKRRRAPPIPAR
jgi:hypothetical protein